MKKTLCVLAAILIAGTQLSAEELSGRQVAEKVKASNHSTKGLVTKGTITLKDMKTNGAESRTAIIFAKTGSDGLRRAAFRFTSGSQKGTTFLSLERSGKDNIQYIYLKSVGKARQVEASDKEKNFVDTDISNESLGGMKLDDYTYKRVADEQVQGRDCYVVENIPVRSDSSYSKRVVYTDKQTNIPLVVKDYNKAGRLVKQSVINANTVKNLRPGLSVPTEMVVTDNEGKHQTLLKVDYAAEENISEDLFNKEKISVKWPQE